MYSAEGKNRSIYREVGEPCEATVDFCEGFVTLHNPQTGDCVEFAEDVARQVARSILAITSEEEAP